MDYEKSVAFEGNFNKAVEVVKNTLLPHGFQIVNSNENSIEMEGTRSVINSGEETLVGISWIHIQKSNNSLILKAEFGVIKKTFRLVSIITILASLITVIILATVFIKKHEPINKFALLLLILASTPISMPIIFKFKKNQTTKSIDTLLNNMTVLGK